MLGFWVRSSSSRGSDIVTFACIVLCFMFEQNDVLRILLET